jgi:hypothetical protein
MKPKNISVGKLYINGTIELSLELPHGWDLKYGRDGADVWFDSNNNTLSIVVRRPIASEERLLITMAGAERLRQQLSL